MFALDQLPRAIGRRLPFAPAVRLLVVTISVAAINVCSAATLVAPPALPVADEVLLVSTRGIGTACNPSQMDCELACHRLAFDSDDKPTWSAFDWHNLQKSEDAFRQTVIYVHGNRVAPGYDASEGIAVYESLINARLESGPLRFIIWSWPSSQIPGLIKDYQVKAMRTNQVAWQLAWFVDQLPSETPLALVGYSYGARAVSGSMHILGGGNVENLKLEKREHADRPAARVALMAAAFDADWILPGEVHQQAITQIERMVVVTNHHDPAMKFFKLSAKIGGSDALGLKGIDQLDKLGAAAKRVQHIDVTAEVGRSHVIYDYLAETRKMNHMWQQLLDEDATPLRDDAIPTYAGLGADAALR